MPFYNAIPKNLLFILFLFVPAGTFAQISLTAENMALGGGGAANVTGFEALFINPANLYINEKSYSLQLSLFQGAYYHDTLLPFSGNRNRFENFLTASTIYDPSGSRIVLNDGLREQIIEQNFNTNRSTSEFASQSEFYWFGLKWVKPNRSYALSLRSRMANRFEIGRGYYSNTPIEIENNFISDQSLHHQYQVFHELSFGFAESFTYLNGLIPQLSEFMIGIAPKVVFSGAYLDADFRNRYELVPEGLAGAFWRSRVSYTQQTAGELTNPAGRFFNTRQPDANPADHSFSDLLRLAGMGFGLDVGITHLITFGDDLSALQRHGDLTDQSLRLSFSITDLGAVYQFRSPFQFQADNRTIATAQPGTLSETVYGGAPNEHYSLLTDHGHTFSFDSHNQENFVILLPTAVHAGMLLQYKRLKLMSDFSYAISKSAFNAEGLISYFGIEIRPLSFLPLRAGTRFGANLPGYYSFGTGLETSRFDLSAAIQVKNIGLGTASEIAGASVLGLKIYIP